MSIFNYVGITLLSLSTTIIFLGAVLYSDRKSREPLHMILICVLSGIFTIGVSLLLGQLILPKLEAYGTEFLSYNLYNGIKIFILALIEEYCKLLVLYIIVSKNRNFDDVYDGFVYSSIIALSFGALETLMYVFNEGTFESMKSLAILRCITSVPLHLMCGIAMGYFMGKEKFSWGRKRRILYLFCSLVVPTVIHFTYNYFINNTIVYFQGDRMIILVMMAFFIPYYILSIVFVNKTILLNQKFISNEKYKNLMTKNEYNEIISGKY